jgi:hypothetical protein
VIAAAEALLVLAVWLGASAAVLTGVQRVSTAGPMLAAAAAGGLLALHGEPLAGALLGVAGVALAFWLRPPAPARATLLPPGSAPVLTLCVVVGVLSVWVGGAVLAGPGGAPSRTAALVLIGLGSSRLIAGTDVPRLPIAALLLAVGLGTAAALEPEVIALRAPVLGAAVAAVAGAVLTFGGSRLRPSAGSWIAAAAGLVTLVLDPGLAVVGLVPLILLFAQLRVEGAAECTRSAALSAALLGIAALAAAPAGGDKLERLAALLAALAVAAAAGVLPHVMELADSDAGRSAFLRRALVAPVLALAVLAKLEPHLSEDPLRTFGACLLGLGALNVVAGLLTGVVPDRLRAWRAAYLAEWGLVLVSLGLLNAAGSAAAYLLVVALVLLRLPPAAWLEAAPDAAAPRRGRARGVVLALALAGAAPFAGFAARLLLLRGATSVAWPFALVLGVALALWLPAAWRLGVSLRQPRSRALNAAQLAGLVATAAIGLYPAAVLRPVGLG